jgi:hypothetical protein
MKSIIFICIVILLSSCSQPPSEAAIQTAIAETQNYRPSPFTKSHIHEHNRTHTNTTAAPVATETSTITAPSQPIRPQMSCWFIQQRLHPRSTLVEIGMVWMLETVTTSRYSFLMEAHTSQIHRINTPEFDRLFFTEAVKVNTSLSTKGSDPHQG